MAEKMANTEGTAGTSGLQVEGDLHIDEALLSRSVYVTGFLPTTKSEDLIIHFQRSRNGGGDIDSIVISKRGAAVITFDSPEVYSRVLQKEHKLAGVTLIVKPFQESAKKDHHSLESTRGSQLQASLNTDTEGTERSVRIGKDAQKSSALKQLLSHGVKFSLYQSDVTDEPVDAIVNAANDGLLHAGGVAAAIVRKGGRQIEQESRQIMFNRNYRPLNVGDAVYTRGGNLCCQFVIHTVGPRWNARERKRCTSLLHRACVESLRLAAMLKLCSIALPAISSGIFGMPKSICAQVMFQAVEEFSSSTDAEFSTLRDVRIVIIDDATIKVFREEFVKRYTSQETSSTTSPHQHRPGLFSSEQEASFALNVTVKGASLSSAYGWSDGQSKRRGKDNGNDESPNKGVVDSNEESDEPGEQIPDRIKNVHPSNNKNVPNANKDIPPSCNKKSSLETEVHGSNKEKGLKDSPLKIRSESSIVATAARPSFGRGRGILATSFYGRPYEEVRSESSGSIQSAETGGTESANDVRAPRNPLIINAKPVIERKTEEAGLPNPGEIPAEKQVSKKMKQGSDENNNWRQVQSDVAQMRQALDEEKRARSIRKQELRQKEAVLMRTLEGNLREEQQARTRMLEELTQARIALNELQERMKNELEQIHNTLDNEIRLRDTMERQLTEKGMIVDQLQNTLGEEQQVRMRLEERLQNEMFLRRARQQELKIKENDSREQQRLLEEERQEKTALEERLREKETIVDQLQNRFGEEQQVRTRLEERLQTEILSSQARQQELQTKENANREQQRLLEEERQQKTTLEERLRNLELQMQEERNTYLSNERELQSAVSAAHEELTEYQRRQPRDWIIQREEVLQSASVLGKGAWGEVREGTFRGCQVAVKEIHEVILSAHNRRLFEREMSIASCCRHPNLLQFIGATNDDGSPLFVTEILDTSLRDLLSERALNHKEVVVLASDVAKGLNYLHLNRPLPIIHRDISSANVLLWRRDECWRAKLSDYGSANFMRQCMTENPGARIYSAPEALTSQQSPKVDVYSFGLLLCEMYVRELPVPQEIHCQIGQVTNGVLRGLIEQCVKRDPEERPTMSDIIYELEQLAQTKRM